MDKPSINFSSDLVLKTLKVMKYIPRSWFSNVSNTLNVNPEEINLIISQLKEADLITYRDSVTEYEMLLLTNTGNHYINPLMPSFKKYRAPSHIRMLKDIHDIHTYIVFRFLIDYLSYETNPIKNILTYTDKDAKIFGSNSSIMSLHAIPDLAIHLQDKTVYLEADTSSEKSSEIYKKLIKYFHLGYNTITDCEHNPIEIYFSFVAKTREYYLFDIKEPDTKYKIEHGIIFKMFNKYTNEIQINSKRFLSVQGDDILRLLKEKKIRIFAGQAKEGWQNYEEVDLANELEKNMN